MTPAKIEAIGLKKIFIHGSAQTVVLEKVNYLFAQGKTYAIIGASGVGKSTLLHLLAALDQPTAGSILFNGHDCMKLSAGQKDQFLNKKIGLLFQDAYLIDELSVLENVIVKGLIAHRPKAECLQEGRELLGAVGLDDKIDSYPLSLSGGQQQRAALARALFGSPSFILADEPTGNLDISMGKKIVDLLLDTIKKNKSGLIVSTHDPYVYERMETILELRDGTLHVYK